MGITSYAQNFEDVILWRAVGNISKGCYIDIGAQHPVVDSVSKAFYERGWRGIHVEPTTEHVNLLRADRPDETVVQAVVSDSPGVIPFYEIPGSGLSTARQDIATEHQAKLGCEVLEILVTAVTLDSLLTLAPSDDIHWLKVDVEGFEREVLSGWRESSRRPWIIIVEATYPNTQVDTFEQWERLVLEKGYSIVYQDGLNRYYLSNQHPELQSCFRFPPNVFDDFQLSGTATSHTRHLKERLSRELASLTSEKADIEARLTAARNAFLTLQTKTAGRERALNLLVERNHSEARYKAETYLKDLVERGHVHAVQIETLQAQKSDIEARLAAAHIEIQAMQAAAENRERECFAQVERAWAELRQAEATHDTELEKRDRTHAAQLEELNRETAETASHLAAAEASLQIMHSTAESRERALSALVERTAMETRQMAEGHLKELLERERAHTDQLTALHAQKADVEAQLAATQKALRLFELAAESRERALSALAERTAAEARQTAEIHLRELLESEREYSASLARISTEARMAAEAHHVELIERERSYASRLESLQDGAKLREDQLAERYLAQMTALRDECGKREEALKQECFAREAALRNDLDARVEQLSKMWDAERTQLQLTIDSLQTHETALEVAKAKLECDLAVYLRAAQELSAEIAVIRQSWSWRLTWPFRLFGKHNDASASDLHLLDLPVLKSTADALLTKPAAEVVAENRGASQLVNADNDLHKRNTQEAIMNLDELLSLPSEAFVRTAYRAIMGREADEVGLRHYLRCLARGCGKASVLYDLWSSDEARARNRHDDLAQLSDEEFIDVLYHRLLGRAPDFGGKQHYLESLRKYGSRKRIIGDIASSAEAKARNDNERKFGKELEELLAEERRARSWRGWWSRGKLIDRRIGILENKIEMTLAAIQLYMDKTSQELADIKNGLNSKVEAAYVPTIVTTSPFLPDEPEPIVSSLQEINQFLTKYECAMKRLKDKINSKDMA